MAERSGFNYDRVLSKWAIVKTDGERHTLASHARYADEVTPQYVAEPGVLKGKKGIAAGLLMIGSLALIFRRGKKPQTQKTSFFSKLNPVNWFKKNKVYSGT